MHTKRRVAIKAPLHPALQTLGKVANGLGESGWNGSQDVGDLEADYALVENVVTGGEVVNDGLTVGENKQLFLGHEVLILIITAVTVANVATPEELPQVLDHLELEVSDHVKDGLAMLPVEYDKVTQVIHTDSLGQECFFPVNLGKGIHVWPVLSKVLVMLLLWSERSRVFLQAISAPTFIVSIVLLSSGGLSHSNSWAIVSWISIER